MRLTNAIATRLRELRTRIGFVRRSDMASHLGLPSSTYSAYEGDAGPPKVEWLVELARRGVNLNWLLTGEGEMLLSHLDPAVASTPGQRLGEHELDEYLLAAMIRRVEREEKDRGRPLSALEKGEMVARLYMVTVRSSEDELASHPLARAAEMPDR